MFRLAHMSDPHLGPLPGVTAGQLASKRITGYVNWRAGRCRNHDSGALAELIQDMRSERPAHIAITGDLINLGLESEIGRAGDWLKSLGRAATVSVVPGNHDAYVPGALERIRDDWRPWMQDDAPVAGRNQFPYMRVRNNVALIGVNSARATAPFMATGFFRRRQAVALAEVLRGTGRRGLCRVVMIHHPPVRRAVSFHKRLVGIGAFQRIIRENGAEIVLHGHTHLPTLNRIDGPDGRVPVVGVAAAGQAPGGSRPAAQYNLIEIDGAAGDWNIRLRRRGFDGGQAGVLQLSVEMLA